MHFLDINTAARLSFKQTRTRRCSYILALTLVALLLQLVAGAHAQCSWEFVRTTLDIKCNLRAIEPQVPLDLQVAETANRLEIQCSADLLHASELPLNAFARLQKLAELQVDACKLQHIPPHIFEGLMSLKRLSLQTHNSVWGPGKALELNANSFVGLRELNELNLSDNNIRLLPEGIWCNMQNLQVLNLTANRIRLAENLGFSEKMCTLNGASGGAELQVLDVSWNELRALPDVWGASRLRRLQQLNLQHNNITAFAPNALAGLSSLRILNLSYNHLKRFPRMRLLATRSCARYISKAMSYTICQRDCCIGWNSCWCLI